MLEDGDLDSAVAQGIVTSAQAAALRNLAARRTRERAVAQGHEERFRFMRGFNDIFFTVGVILFVSGLAYFVGANPIGCLVIAAVFWGLAEVLVLRLRLVLPGILIAAGFVGCVVLGVPIASWIDVSAAPQMLGKSMVAWLGSSPGLSLVVFLEALIGAAAASAFYWRFRLPFTLLPLALALGIAVLAVASKVAPTAPIWDPVLLLACALGIFAAAMVFDLSDRERLTLRADCAFWLHLLAAPLIVHSIIWLISPGLESSRPRIPGPYWNSMTPALASAIVLVFAVLALVAILVDRRALLVSGLAYLGTAIAYAISSTAFAKVPLTVAATFTLLGGLVLALGIGWMPLRRRVLRLLPMPFAANLPPVPAAT